MVARWRNLLVVIIGGVVTLLGAIVASWPPRGTFEHAGVISLKTALGVYRDRAGRYPESLLPVCDTLREVTRLECECQRSEGTTYVVAIKGPKKVSRIRIKYSGAEDGSLKLFDVIEVTTSSRLFR